MASAVGMFSVWSCGLFMKPGPQVLFGRQPTLRPRVQPCCMLEENFTISGQLGEPQPGGSIRESVSETRDYAASVLRVTPAYMDTAIGCILFVTLNAGFKEATFLLFDSPEADTLAGRLLALVAFAAIQQFAFLPLNRWLRIGSDQKSADPFFSNPADGVIFAFIFAVPLAGLAQLCDVSWLPEPRPFPPPEAALLKTVVAPLSEEVFFRAWLLTAFGSAGGSQSSALIASTVLFGLYHVPLSTILAPEGSSLLLVYQALGAYLAFLYQRSGGSLPLVFVTHATCNLLVLALRDALVNSVMPF